MTKPASADRVLPDRRFEVEDLGQKIEHRAHAGQKAAAGREHHVQDAVGPRPFRQHAHEPTLLDQLAAGKLGDHADPDTVDRGLIEHRKGTRR